MYLTTDFTCFPGTKLKILTLRTHVALCTQFTCCTGTKVQILTQKALLGNHSRLQLVCAGCCGNGLLGALGGTKFTGFAGTKVPGFTGAKVQILTADNGRGITDLDCRPTRAFSRCRAIDCLPLQRRSCIDNEWGNSDPACGPK